MTKKVQHVSFLCLAVVVPALAIGLFFSGLFYHFKVVDKPYPYAIIQGHISHDSSTIWIRNVEAKSFTLLLRASQRFTTADACVKGALSLREKKAAPKPEEPKGSGGGGEEGGAAAEGGETQPTPAEDEVFGTDMVYLTEEGDDIGVVKIRELRPSTCYVYKVMFSAKKNYDEEMRHLSTWTGPSSTTFSEIHSFFTAPLDSNPTPPINVLFGSCVSRTFFPPFNKLSIFTSILHRHTPALSLILGDVAYSDLHESLPYFRSPLPRAFRNTWSDDNLRTFASLTPTYSQRDDHEVYNDHVGPMPAGVLPMWKRWVADRHPHFVDVETGDKDEDVLYYHFEYGRALSVFVLDMRSHANPASSTVLGAEQVRRLKAWLLSRPPSSLKVLAAPMMFTAVPSMAAPFAMAPEEKEDIRKFIRDRKICGVVVLSGDTHWGGAWDLMEGGGMLEFAASPFQALPFPGSPFFGGPGNEEGEKKLFFSSFGYHYGLLEMEGTTGGVEEESENKARHKGARAVVKIFKFWPWDKEATMVYERQLDVSQMCPASRPE